MRARSTSRDRGYMRTDNNAVRVIKVTATKELFKNGFLNFSLGNKAIDKNQVSSEDQIERDIEQMLKVVSESTIEYLHSEVTGVNPFVIGMTYLRQLATESILVEADHTEVKISSGSAKFGSVDLDMDMITIEKKLNVLKKQNSHKPLSGVLYVKGNYEIRSTSRGKRLTVDKIEESTGALHVGTAEDPLLLRSAETQRASSPASLVALKCIGFSIHSPDYTMGRKYAEDLNLYTCLTRHDEVVFTARSFSDIKTITYSILKISDNASGNRRSGFRTLSSLPMVIVGLGFDDSSYDFDKVLFELGEQLDGHTVTYIFKSETITSEDAREIMQSNESWVTKRRTCEDQNDFEINPFTKHEIHRWHYALTFLEADSGYGDKKTEYKNEKSLHSLTIPIPTLPGRSIQVNNHVSNAGHLFNFAEEVERIVQTFVAPVAPE